MCIVRFGGTRWPRGGGMVGCAILDASGWTQCRLPPPFPCVPPATASRHCMSVDANGIYHSIWMHVIPNPLIGARLPPTAHGTAGGGPHGWPRDGARLGRGRARGLGLRPAQGAGQGRAGRPQPKPKPAGAPWPCPGAGFGAHSAQQANGFATLASMCARPPVRARAWMWCSPAPRCFSRPTSQAPPLQSAFRRAHLIKPGSRQ